MKQPSKISEGLRCLPKQEDRSVFPYADCLHSLTEIRLTFASPRNEAGMQNTSRNPVSSRRTPCKETGIRPKPGSHRSPYEGIPQRPNHEDCLPAVRLFPNVRKIRVHMERRMTRQDINCKAAVATHQAAAPCQNCRTTACTKKGPDVIRTFWFLMVRPRRFERLAFSSGG